MQNVDVCPRLLGEKKNHCYPLVERELKERARVGGPEFDFFHIASC